MDKKLSMAVVGLIVMSIAIGVQAIDIFNGGAGTTDWATDANWDSGTAPGTSLSGDLAVGASMDYTTAQGDTTVAGYFNVSGNTEMKLLDGTLTVYQTLDAWSGITIGGQQNTTSTLTINGGSLVTPHATQGFTIGNANNRTSTLSLISGSLSVATSNIKIGEDTWAKTGILDISGGTASLGSKPVIHATYGFINFGDNDEGTLDISGADQAYYEGLYTAGRLTHGGTQTGTFAEDFEVTGTTITAIPEPASLGLLAALGAALLFIRRELRD